MLVIAIVLLAVTSVRGLRAEYDIQGVLSSTADSLSQAVVPLSTESNDPVFRFKTSEGDFDIAVHPQWAPKGAEQFSKLVKAHFFDQSTFFRAIDGFMIQFGLPADPGKNKEFSAPLEDDPHVDSISNTPGMLTFATSGANSRTTQMFLSLVDNGRLDSMGFTPFGEVVGGPDGDGMSVIRTLYTGYGEGAPGGNGPDQSRVTNEGASYLLADFPLLSKILSVEALESAQPEPAEEEGSAVSSGADPVLVDCTPTHDSGVMKSTTQVGAGDPPKSGAMISAHYTGTLQDGTKFDSSRDRGVPFKFPLGAGQVIKGWDLGFAQMQKGEKAILTIKSDYGYGDRGSPPTIPGGATLIFDVELLDFQ